MIVDQTIARAVYANIRKAKEEDSSRHVHSGKLSAGRLFWPLQWQILHSIGVKPPEFDDYALGKFTRGDHVEDFVVLNMPGVIDTQVEIEYRGVTGKLDALVDSSEYEYKNGVIPHEIKSVANAKFKWIKKRMSPDMSHALQAICYGIALKRDKVIIDYVASDDYRVLSFVLDVQEWRPQVDSAIDEYDAAMANWKENGVLPELVARESWQLKPEWATYPDTLGKTAQEVKEMFGI